MHGPKFSFPLLLFIVLFFSTCSRNQNSTQNHSQDIKTCDSVTIIAGVQYKSGRIHKIFFGNQYREEWTTPVKVPCLDITTFKGGLTINKMGGGRQTKSLRVMTSDNVEYTIRSVDKNPEALLPKPLRNTFFKDILQDMIATAHPYGALIVPPLASAAGIHHTKPQLFFLPYSDALGEYKEDIGGMLAIIEIRPDEDLSDFGRFGFSDNVVGTDKLYEKLRESSFNQVDEELYLKTRLFDMFLNDWDRHEDQWRWAEFEKNNQIIFEPVPRDRDQVFVKMEGVVPYIITRKWGVRNIRNFDHAIDDVVGMNLNARFLDRIILNELGKKEWLRIANTLKNQITDSVIQVAVKKLPPEIYAISGKELISKMVSRRNIMVDVAKEYYDAISKKVNIIGSDNDEIFEIIQKEKTVMVLGKNQNKTFFKREFNADETKEIYIHSLGGNNQIKFLGDDSEINITLYTGDGENKIITGNGIMVKNLELVNEPSNIYMNKVYRG